MKTKLSLLTLFACAAGTMLFAEAIEGYPVIIYDTSDSPIALATSLNDAATYINGADGDKAEIYADDTITSTITFDRDTYWQLVSDSDAMCTISGTENTTLFDISSGSMKLILDSITFSGASGKVFYSRGGGDITLGGNAEFKNNSSYAVLGNTIFLENSEMTFSGNTGSYVLYGNVQICSGSALIFSQNQPCVYGELTAGDNVSLSFSNNAGKGIRGNVSLGNNAIFSASGNSDLVIDGTTISFGEKSQLSFSGNTYGIVDGNTNIGADSTLTVSNNKGTLFDGNLTIGNNSTATFEGNTRINSSNSVWVVDGDLTVGEQGSVILNNNDNGIYGAVKVLSGGNLSITGCADNSELQYGVRNGLTSLANTYLFFSGNDCAVNGTLVVGMDSEAFFEKNSYVAPSRTYGSYGSAVRGDVQIAGGATAKFSENSSFIREYSSSPYASSLGGAVYGDVQIGKESTIIFFENSSSSSHQTSSSESYSSISSKSNSYGGAIYGNIGIVEGSTATFSGNLVSSSSRATYGVILSPVTSIISSSYSYSYGGAVYGDVRIGEGAVVTFSGNSSTSSSYAHTNTSYSDSYSYGGAVYGSVQIRGDSIVIFSENFSSSSSEADRAFSYSYGGAICGDVQIYEGSKVTFSGNSSSSSKSYGGSYSFGGAIYTDSSLDSFDGGIILSGNIEFESNSTSENDVISGKGGAIWAETISFNTTVATEKITFSKNKSGSGGAIYLSSGSITSSSASNILLSQNNATGGGGGIYLSGGTSSRASFSGTLEFDGNSAASYGGAIYSGYDSTISFNSSSRNTFSENSASTGGAIDSSGTLTFYAGSETQFNKNAATTSGGAIYSSSEISLYGSADFTGNTSGASGGAIYSSALNIYDGAKVHFSKNIVSNGSGGAIYATGATSFSGGSVVTFSKNSATNGTGGAIYSTNTIELSGESEFTGNTVTYNLADGTATTTTGGAISVLTSVSFALTSKATFSGNSITATEKIDTRGGAIYSKSVSLAGDLRFENNTISTVGSTSINSGGGAIYADGAVNFAAGTTAKFIGNTITSKATQSFGGGAIFADTISLAGNVDFTNNTVTNSTLSTMFSSGGAIFAFSGLEFSDGTTATFTGNSAAYGGAINSYKGYLTFTEKTKAVFSGNSAARGGAIYADAGTFTLAGDVQFLNNTASAQGGAIRLGETTLVCEGDTTKVVFSGNKVGSDAKGWMNNDILLVKAISSMTIRDAGTYEFGGGIDASAGGALSISEANVTFQSGSETKLGGATTISDGANITLGAGTAFDLVSGATLSVEDNSVVKLHTNLSEATVITVAAGASVTFEETAKLIIDISTDTLARSPLLSDIAKIAIIRATDELGIGDLGEIELLVNGETFDGSWMTVIEDYTLYLTMAIPEPSTFGLLVGLGMFVLTCSRRRRSRGVRHSDGKSLAGRYVFDRSEL